MPNTLPARERVFLTGLARDLHLTLSWDEYDEEDQNLVVLRFPAALGSISDEDNENDSQDEPDTTAAVDRALRKYDEAEILKETVEDNFGLREEHRLEQKMDEWKRTYYSRKLGISYDDPDQMHSLIFCYIEGVQWVMHYYYSGVCSWGWFYRYHYAPRMSDFVEVDKMAFHFELGNPFQPFEQLMGVLPEASKELVPPAYRPLMCNVDSPILDFYPGKFELDMNGKKHEWEAIVKIPFIDQNRLLQAMRSKECKLTEEERKRNSFGTTLSFAFRPGPPTAYPSSLPGIFPALHRCHCVMEPYDLPTLDDLHLVQGLCEGVLLGAQSLAGFPSLQTVPHHAKLGNHGVNIHGTESRNKSMVIHVENLYEERETQELAEEMIGQRVFVGWPFLREGKVTAVSDSSFRYKAIDTARGASETIESTPHLPQEVGKWKSKSERIRTFYSKRCGVITGAVDVLIHVVPLKGMKTLDSGALVKEYETPEKEMEQAVQMIVTSVTSEDPRYVERMSLPLSEEFPIGTNLFFLGDKAYGAFARISGTTDTSLSIILTYFPQDRDENERFKALVRSQVGERYYPFFEVSKMVGLSQKVVSRLTSKVMAIDGDHTGKVNIGLSVKFEAKAQKVIGYSRKIGRHWEFSRSTVDLIREYKEKFPEVTKHLEKDDYDFLQLSKVFPGSAFNAKTKELKAWLGAKGVRDFEAVPLNCDHVGKETVRRIEQLADQLKRDIQTKKARADEIPRQAVLKPEYAAYRLRDQRFGIGDRVVMVRGSGSVPLLTRGVVIGINVKTVDVVWDVSFMSGSSLGNKCSPRRGATVEFHACLNLSHPQMAISNLSELHQLRLDSHPQQPPPQSVWKASGNRGSAAHSVVNPHQGRSGFINNHRGGTTTQRQTTGSSSNLWENSPAVEPGDNLWGNRSREWSHSHGHRGGASRGGSFRGRGGFTRSTPPTRGGGLRGRGRGQDD